MVYSIAEDAVMYNLTPHKGEIDGHIGLLNFK